MQLQPCAVVQTGINKCPGRRATRGMLGSLLFEHVYANPQAPSLVSIILSPAIKHLWVSKDQRRHGGTRPKNGESSTTKAVLYNTTAIGR